MSKKSDSSPHWSVLAQSLPSDEVQLTVPIHAFLNEVDAVAKFFDANWATVRDPRTKAVVKLGLDSAGKQLPKTLSRDLRELSALLSESNFEYERASDPKSPTAEAISRGRAIVDEITATLAWHLDDGVEDKDDADLAAIEAAHKDDPPTADALALELEDFVRLARPHAKELAGLGGFDPATLDEGLAVAATLRSAPLVPGFTSSPKVRAAMGLRNRYFLLLQERVDHVRNAARFVYRDDPGAVPTNVSSGYAGRRKILAKRAAARKAKHAKGAQPQTPAPTTPAHAQGGQ
jgi:hypothetical protein